MTAYAALQVTTNFSFLRGASHPAELVEQAKLSGLAALAVTDRNTLAGVVRAHAAAREHGLRLVVGCRLDLQDAPSLLCYPTDRAAYGRLCRLLTLGQRRAEKGKCDLRLGDVSAHAAGQVFAVVPPDDLTPDDLAPDNLADDAAGFAASLADAAAALGAPVYLMAHHLYRGDDRRRIAALAALAARAGTPLLAGNDVLYHVPGRRPLQDVLTCIREGCTVEAAGWRLAANAERHLKTGAEMARLFRGHADAVGRTLEVVDACRFSLDELRYEYPDEPVPPGRTPQEHLEALTREGAAWRYPDGVPDKVAQALRHELALIGQLGYAPYFLTVHDIVRYARGQGILCQGRGSAANSAVCYCLGITAVDPAQIDLLFERFVSAERREPPDIDVDFEHERREEVIQYIYRRYGRERAGLAATVITYGARSAVRDVGKAMGLSQDAAGALAATVWGRSGQGIPESQVREAGLDPRDRRLRQTLVLTETLLGFPRHLSQHVGGFVLTRGPLCEVIPIGNAAMADRTVVEWDKDDLDALGILKVDVLALGMLTCIRKGFDLLAAHYGRPLTLATLPREDPQVYDMLCDADSIGVFQVESRAQMNMLPRLRPRCFYDLVIEVAIVRPGPIQGDMVHPYLRRRSGVETVDYPCPAPEHGPPDELAQVLKKTLGVPLFQEQAMRIAIAAAKFTPDEANQLRRAMATFRRSGTIHRLKDKMVGRMIERGYDPDVAERCFKQIEGFGEYGFPESHSASFSLLVYVSAWLKCHYPAVFACALLNAQPMGFYAPAQIVRDARDHGVAVRPVDLNASDWDCTLEPLEAGEGAEKAAEAADGWALRLGMRQVDGLAADAAAAIVAARDRPYTDLHDAWRRAGVPAAALERLAAADACRSLGRDRRQALWEVRALKGQAPLPLFAHAGARAQGPEPAVALPAMRLSEHVVADYRTVRLSLKAHPMAFLRAGLARRGVVPTGALAEMRHGGPVAVAGVVLVRQRPGSAHGVIFVTLEDETGVANAVIWPKVMERYRKAVLAGRLLLIRGRIERHERIIHVMAQRIEDWSFLLHRLTADPDEAPETALETAAETAARDARDPARAAGLTPPLARADEVRRPGPDPYAQNPRRHPRDVRIIPRSRDFH